MTTLKSGPGSESSDPGPVLGVNYAEMPYWWCAARPETSSGAEEVSGTVDVAIVGSGVTGSVAALELARAGASVVVFDMQEVGEGAARRNAGFLGRTLKRTLHWLDQRHGPAYADAVYRELDEALRELTALVAAENIDCCRQTCGRVISANSEAHLRLLIADLQHMKDRLGFEFEPLGPADMRREIASEAYVGGAVLPELGSIHPGLYHQGLVHAARGAGVRYLPRTEVQRIEAGDGLKTMRTSRGELRARHVVVATNGYTSLSLGWFARRVIPFRGFVITTELLAPELIAKVLPHGRTYLDTRLNIDFLRPAPDSSRIIFGGMTGSAARSARSLAAELHGRLVRILPDLAGSKVEFGWTGYCAGTFDFMPHIGLHSGVHFAMGYNFAGMPIGTLFGRKLARKILGRPGATSIFEQSPFPTAALYRGRPWFVPLAMRFFDWQDARLARRRVG